MKTLSICLLFAMVILPVTAYAIDDPALVLYCNFEEGSGDTVKDQASGLSGMISGADWTENGKIGGGMEFTAGDNFVEFPADPVLDITEAITMEAWVYANQVQGDSGVMGRRTGGNAGGYCMQWTNAMFETWMHKGGWQGTRGMQTLQPDTEEWHHIAAVYTGSEVIQYVDGEVDAKLALSGALDSQEEVFRIGQAQTGLESMFGIIDEVAVYSRALSADEITTDMNQGVIPAAVSPNGNLATTWGKVKDR